MGLSRRLFRVWCLFLWSVFVLGLIRLEYIVWNLKQLRDPAFADLVRAAFYGLRFDLAASGWLIAPVILLSLLPWPAQSSKWWERLTLGLFLLIQLPFWFVNLVDVEFVNFVGRRMTGDVLFILGEAQGKAGGFISAYGLLLLINTIFLAIGAVGGAGVFLFSRKIAVPKKAGWKTATATALASIIALVILTRGGLQEKPLHFVNAQVFANPGMNLVVLNSTFTVLKSLNQKKLPKLSYFENPDEMKSLLNGSVQAPSLLEGKRFPAPQNVVILILESFGQEYMGEVNGLPGYTPFLDSLANKGLFFKNAFANGRRSIEGIPAVLSSVPSLMNEPFVTSSFSNADFPGLGTLLKAKNYRTSFFHGGNNGTMHFDAYTESAGIDSYFGAKEYPDPKDHDGVWGIYDGPMLQWMKLRLDEMPEPFLASFFSLSSHNPYKIPDAEKNLYPEGPIPILKTIAYTDESLRRFFAAAEKEPWFQNTLFVITADHTFLPYRPEFDHDVGRYRIPILFYHPRMNWPAEIDRDQVVQQIDILPSVLDFLGFPQTTGRNLLARSVFVPGERTAAVFVDGMSMIFGPGRFLVWPPNKDPQLYTSGDAKQRHPLDEPETKSVLERRLKAALQYFTESMHGNRWQ